MDALNEQTAGLWYVVALAFVIVMWVAVRLALGQSPLHLWLGANVAGAVAAVAATLRPLPSIGPIAELTMVAAALFTGCCFTLGVYAEARDNEAGYFPIVAAFAVSLALALVLELAITDAPLRHAVMRTLLGLTFLGALLWIPQLLRNRAPKVGSRLLAIIALTLAAIQGTHTTYTLLTTFAILAAGFTYAIFSVERARES